MMNQKLFPFFSSSSKLENYSNIIKYHKAQYYSLIIITLESRQIAKFQVISISETLSAQNSFQLGQRKTTSWHAKQSPQLKISDKPGEHFSCRIASRAENEKEVILGINNFAHKFYFRTNNFIQGEMRFPIFPNL